MVTRICDETGDPLLIPDRNVGSKVGSIIPNGRNEPKMRGSRIGEK
jgi:hypothetical protein